MKSVLAIAQYRNSGLPRQGKPSPRDLGIDLPCFWRLENEARQSSGTLVEPELVAPIVRASHGIPQMPIICRRRTQRSRVQRLYRPRRHTFEPLAQFD